MYALYQSLLHGPKTLHQQAMICLQGLEQYNWCAFFYKLRSLALMIKYDRARICSLLERATETKDSWLFLWLCGLHSV